MGLWGAWKGDKRILLASSIAFSIYLSFALLAACLMALSAWWYSPHPAFLSEGWRRNEANGKWSLLKWSVSSKCLTIIFCFIAPVVSAIVVALCLLL